MLLVNVIPLRAYYVHVHQMPVGTRMCIAKVHFYIIITPFLLYLYARAIQ